eukprot:6075853-Pyramimonas_sp.AAC.1
MPIKALLVGSETGVLCLHFTFQTCEALPNTYFFNISVPKGLGELRLRVVRCRLNFLQPVSEKGEI